MQLFVVWMCMSLRRFCSATWVVARKGLKVQVVHDYSVMYIIRMHIRFKPKVTYMNFTYYHPYVKTWLVKNCDNALIVNSMAGLTTLFRARLLLWTVQLPLIAIANGTLSEMLNEFA